jgi:glycosyltransferase involved in cell wall biosynthesis
MKATCGASRAIHQLVAGFADSDAISNEAIVMRGLFRSWGHDSDIFCAPHCISTALRQDCRVAAELAAAVRPDDIVILHLSIGSAVNDLFASLSCRRAIIYHNMTPADYFRGVNEAIGADLARGREQAAALAGSASVVMADSRYNAAEIEALGYGPARIMPLLLDFSRIRIRPDPATLRAFDDGKANILFVGRCAPNKRVDDLISAFYYFQKFVEPDSRLILAGSTTGVEKYLGLLQARVHELGLQNVLFLGSVPQAKLNACYAGADLFLCMSEHEGFCIPLIESMAHNAPILAYAAAAVPETLDGAGVLFREKRWDLVAEMMGCLVNDQAMRKAVLAKQQRRLARYERLDLEHDLRDCLAPLLSRPERSGSAVTPRPTKDTRKNVYVDGKRV